MSEIRETLKDIFGRMSFGDRSGQVAVLSIAVIIVLVAAITALPDSSEDTAGLAGSEGSTGTQTFDSGGREATPGTQEDDDTSEAAPTTDTTDTEVSAGTDEAPTDEFVENPEANTSFAAEVGRRVQPVTTEFPGGNKNTWAGVTEDEIKAVFSYDASNCGVNLVNALSQAGANFSSGNRYYRPAPTNQDTANEETRQAVDTLVKVFNQRGLDTEDFPAVHELQLKHGSTPERPFYGRKLVHEFIDGGSFQCPERTTAAAVEIAQERKPFVVYNNFDGAQYNMADALNAKAPEESRPMHFGTLWLSDEDYDRWAPYNWTQFNSGTRAVELYASWICSTKVGENADNSPEMAGQERKWGLLYPNLKEVQTVADELKGYVKDFCGEDIYEAEFAYAPDASRAGDEATTIAVRLKTSGITTLTYLMDPIFPLFQINAFIAQDYYPEIAWTPTGYYDSNVVQRLYDQDFMNERSFGITQFGVPGGFGFTAGDAFWAWHDNHKVSPNTGQACDPSSDEGMDHDPEYCKAPGAIVTWYYTTLASLASVLFAGPDLTPEHATQGLWRYPSVRYGTAGPTDAPHPALLGSDEGRYYFIIDATEYKWRAWYQSPPIESKLGWVEYPDCERHYTMWPDGLARNWEKDGPNYNAFCGNEKYAPEDTEVCEDAPEGRCERDNYPPWQEY